MNVDIACFLGSCHMNCLATGPRRGVQHCNAVTPCLHAENTLAPTGSDYKSCSGFRAAGVAAVAVTLVMKSAHRRWIRR